MSESKQKLPPETEDNIVEVDIRHVILAFGGIVVGSLTIGTTIVVAKDIAKYKRQKALIDAAMQFIITIQEGGETTWNEKKMGSLSPMKTSRKPKKSLDTSD